jgi:hypothetical protein
MNRTINPPGEKQAWIEVQTIRHQESGYLSTNRADRVTNGICIGRIIVLFAEHHNLSGRKEQHASVFENH